MRQARKPFLPLATLEAGPGIEPDLSAYETLQTTEALPPART